MKLGEPDESGRKSPVGIKGSEYSEEVDFVVEAIGLQPTTSIFKNELELAKNGRIKVNAKTLQTSTPWIFAGGDAVTGSSTIIEAVGQGKKLHFISTNIYLIKILKILNPAINWLLSIRK